MSWLRRHPNAVLLLAVAIILTGIVLQSYEGRVSVVNAQRQGCQRTQVNSHANAESWYSAYIARLAQAQVTSDPTLRKIYENTAGIYLRTAATYNEHVDPAHSVTWPLGSSTHPLGVGHLFCARAYPAPSVLHFFN